MIEYAQVNDWCQDDFLQLSKARDIYSESSALKKIVKFYAWVITKMAIFKAL